MEDASSARKFTEMKKYINLEDESRSSEKDRMIDEQGERRASVTKIIMVRDKRVSSLTELQSNKDNITSTSIIQHGKDSSSIQGFGIDNDKQTTVKRYSVTQILPVRRKISADDALFSISRYSVKRNSDTRLTKEEMHRRFSVTKIMPIRGFEQPQQANIRNEIVISEKDIDLKGRKELIMRSEAKIESFGKQTQRKELVRKRSIEVMAPLLQCVEIIRAIQEVEEIESPDAKVRTTISIEPIKEETNLEKIEEENKKSSQMEIDMSTTSKKETVISEEKAEEKEKRKEKTKKKHVSFDILPEKVHEYRSEEETQELEEIEETDKETDDEVSNIINNLNLMLKEEKEKSKKKDETKIEIKEGK